MKKYRIQKKGSRFKVSMRRLLFFWVDMVESTMDVPSTFLRPRIAYFRSESEAIIAMDKVQRVDKWKTVKGL